MSQPPYLQWPLFRRSSVAAFDRSLSLLETEDAVPRFLKWREPDASDTDERD
jgi:hypothetical protein